MPEAVREPAVVYAGRLDEAKGLRLLMTGWDCYAGHPGSPGTAPRHRRRGAAGSEVALGGGAPVCELAGQVTPERCAELMSPARAVLLPSAWEETFGLVAIEAMALGVPPVAAARLLPRADHLRGRRRSVRPGDPAALASAIADIAAHPELYESYGKHARETYTQRFDPDRSIEQLLEIYRYAIAHPAGAS